MLQAEDVLEKVTDDVVIEIMEEHGSPLYRRTIDNRTGQECLWFRTICHGGDSHKLCYFTDTKDFYCYTSCGRMRFFDFIKKVENFSDNEFFKCVLYVAKKSGVDIHKQRIGLSYGGSIKSAGEEITAGQKLVFSREEANKKKNNPLKIKKFYNSNILNYFDNNTFYQGWIDEGISIKSMQKFKIEWYEFQKHIIIPHFDINGNLVGIRRRSLKAEDSRNKYMPEYLEGISYEHPLGLNLYGLYENQKAIKKQETAIIVEGEKSVLLSDSYYGDNSITVATCGFNISDFQLKELKKLGVRKVFLGFDKDFDMNKEEEYKKDEIKWRNYLNYKRRLDILAEKADTYFVTYVLKDRKGLLGPKDSPFDKGKEVLEELKRTSQQIIKDEYIILE